MSKVDPTSILTENEKQAFIFGYIKGQMIGIHSATFDGKKTKESDEQWLELAQYSSKVHDVLCEKMGISDVVDVPFGCAIENLEDEVEEIVRVYEKEILSTQSQGSK